MRRCAAAGLRHRPVGLEPHPVVTEPFALVPHHPGRVVGVPPFDRPQRLDELRHRLLVAGEQIVDLGQRQRIWHHGCVDSVFEAAAAVDERDHRRGQQHAVLHDVDPAVGEPAFVAQPHDAEFEVLLGVAARDEVRRHGSGRAIPDQGPARRHEGLRHHLPAERAGRVLARVGSDERVVVDPDEAENRQQLFEVAYRHCSLLPRRRPRRSGARGSGWSSLLCPAARQR